MHIRCPHCHNRIEVVDDNQLNEVCCPSCGSAFNLVGERGFTTQPLETRTLGHFELLEQLGFGHFGSVWKARDKELDRIVAVKIPRRDDLSEAEAEYFLREARAAAQLRHPNIVSVHEVGREEGTIYIVSDYIEGANLRQWLSGQKLTSREAAELCAKISGALHDAHVAGVVHRDLKPENIMMDLAGEPHIMDFGLAKRENGEITMTRDGHVLGTPAYMPPEQARGEGHHADRRSDVYSLGVILYELLTGELPFRGEMRMLIVQILRDDAPSPRKLNSRIPRDLETICLKCLEKDPGRRYATAAELSSDLRLFLDERPIVARPIGRLVRGWRWAARHPSHAVASTLAVLLVILSVVGINIYVVQSSEASVRQASLEREIWAALDEAEEIHRDLYDQLQNPLKAADLLSDLKAWESLVHRARAASRRAIVLATTGQRGISADLAERLRWLEQQVSRDEEDWQLAFKLDKIRLDASVLVEGKWKPWHVVPEIGRAFRDAGYDVEQGSTEEAGRRIARSRIRHALVAALDYWAFVMGGTQLRPRLLAVARYADPDPWRDRFRRAEVWADLGKLQALAAEVEPAQHSPQVLVALADALMNQGARETSLLHRSLVYHPRDFWLLYELGLCSRDRVEQVGAYRAALAVRPDAAAVYTNIGRVLRRQGNYDGAVAHCRQALAIDSKDAQAHFGLAMALDKKGDYEGKIRHYREAVAIDPQYDNAHNNLGFALYCRAVYDNQDKSDLDVARKHYRQALAVNPKYANAHDNLADVLRTQGDLRGALEHYRAALALDPKIAKGRYRDACEFALALAGKGKDAVPLGENEKASLRRRTLDCLQTELLLLAQGLTKKSDASAAEELRAWQQNTDLASVRDEAALRGLSAEERTAWQQFWDEVAAVRKRFSAPDSQPKP